MPSVHPTVVIDLAKYGMEGKVVLSEPTVRRLDILHATVIGRFLTDKDREEYDELPTHKRDAYLKPFIRRRLRTYQTMCAFAYIEESPWRDYDEFMGSATKSVSDAISRGIEELDALNPFALMDPYHEYDMGVSLFKSGVEEGTSDPYVAYYVAYAEFLQNHSKEEWENMTNSDITMFMAYRNTKDERNMGALASMIANKVGKVFGGKEE